MSVFAAIRIEGGFLGPDTLDLLLAGELPGQQPRDFGLDGRRSLTDEIASVFADARAQWEVFRHRVERLPEADPATSVTRDAWVIPFLSLLGYELHYNLRTCEVDGASFAISHRAGEHNDAPPVHVVGARQELGRVAPTGRTRLAPHSLVQEFLNRSEHLWGLVTNGMTLRLLRDSTSIRRQAYLEFDLKQIFEEQRFTDFAALYRLLHRTRLPRSLSEARECWLEKYYQHSLEQGGRVRERLRDGVEQCIKRLADGFLAHPDNTELRERITSSQQPTASREWQVASSEREEHLPPTTRHLPHVLSSELYRQLLRLVYRCLFLLVSEDRGLISGDPIYRQHYGISRLRWLLDRRSTYTEHDDLWCSLRVLWKVLSDERLAALLGAAPLNGELFAPLDLDTCTITNRDLLEAFWHLAYYRETPSGSPCRVNYAALDVEELGSIYESLLEYHPQIDRSGAVPQFALATGSERRETGSYYTPPELVAELIHSALEPVLTERLHRARQRAEDLKRVASREWREVYQRIQQREGEPHAHSIVSRLSRLAKSDGLGRANSAYLDTGPGISAGMDSCAQPSTQEPTAQPQAELAAIWSRVPLATRHWLLARVFAEQAIFSIRVLDPACGSGHFLLAAARRLGKELARIRTGEDEPAPERVREAIRDVVAHCIYGVDKNPLAVELCRVALWLEAHCEGKPLTFLDHRIRCGDSLVGVVDLEILKTGIPDEAFAPVSSDDRAVAAHVKRQNRSERRAFESGQLRLPFDPVAVVEALGREEAALEQIPDDSPELVRKKKQSYERYLNDSKRLTLAQACNLWTAAFFQQVANDQWQMARAITTQTVLDRLENRAQPQAVAQAEALAHRLCFFHWPLEFPEVFADGGFDVVLCNPPWERIKLQEEEFFATRDLDIAHAANKAERAQRIRALQTTNRALWEEYQNALHDADALSKFLRQSGRFPLTARGDINTYSVFAELFVNLLRPEGRAGVVVPTGIATDATNQRFFAHLVESGRLVSLYDFENREGLFPGVHRSYKFSLVTLRGHKPDDESQPKEASSKQRVASSGRERDQLPFATCHSPAQFAFFLTRAAQLEDPARRFTLAPEDFRLLNPNTRTCPVFRTRQDAELTKAIYRRVPVLVNEPTGENPWGVRFLAMFHMANDSHLFRAREQLERAGFRLFGNVFVKGNTRYVPLYEAKMIWHYDHRFGTYEGVNSRSSTHLPPSNEAQHADPSFLVQPWYWVPAEEVEARLSGWDRGWLLGWRDIARSTDERTAIFSLSPRVGVGDKFLLMLPEVKTHAGVLLAALDNLCFDYGARQKVGGVSLKYFTMKQLPVLPPSAYTSQDLCFIVPRVLELVYTAWDIKPFADDVWADADAALRKAIKRQWEENRAATGGVDPTPPEWFSLFQSRRSGEGIALPPFKWQEARRAVLRAELDAYYARLYGLSRKQLRYILDPADLTERELEDILDPWEEVTDPLDSQGYAERVAKSTFPGETFRVLKEKEMRQFGEYRTRRLVLEAWETMVHGHGNGKPRGARAGR